jgi:hypothetical protein
MIGGKYIDFDIYSSIVEKKSRDIHTVLSREREKQKNGVAF